MRDVRTIPRAGRLLTVLTLAGVTALGVTGCAVMKAIKNRLPGPHPTAQGVKFQYEAPAAQVVTLAGNFNNWGGTQGGGRYDPNIDPMVDPDDDGVWEITLPLPPGRYQYKYVIDQVRWERDPSNPYTDFEAGIENSLLVVPSELPYVVPEGYLNQLLGTSARVAEGAAARSEPRRVRAGEGVLFRLQRPGAGRVFVAGTWNNWKGDEIPLVEGSDGVWEATVPVPRGRHEYKFIVDGVWVADPENPDVVEDPFGGTNSVLVVE